MLTTATATSRRLDYNDETDINESDDYDLEQESEVKGSEEDEDDGDKVYTDAFKHLKKHGHIWLHLVKRVTSLESGLQGYTKQKAPNDYA